MRTFDIKRIIQFNKLGLSNRQIANILCVHHNTISYWLKKHKLQSKWANFTINIVGKNKAKCSKCNKIKNLKQFQHGRKGQKYQYKFSYCKSCRKKQTYLNLNSDVNKFLSDRFNRLKRRCTQNKILINITKEEFINLYHKQKGKCFYTKEPLLCKVGKGLNRNSLSIDKLIPKQGYTSKNVVLCTHKANSIKNDLTLNELKKWIPKWYNKIKRKLND